MAEITAEFKKLIFRSPHEGNDFCIAKVRTEDKKELTILGDSPDGKFITGVSYRFSGDFSHNEKYDEDQFKFKHFVQLEPRSRRGVTKYLEKYADGVGPTIAARLWDEYQQEAVQMLRINPDACSMAVPMLSNAAAHKASESLTLLKEDEDTRIELTNLFQGRSFHGSIYDAVMQAWGCEAPAIIKRDPFKLLVKGFKSVSFNRADQLYQDLGHDPGRLKRQMLYMWNMLSSDTNGDTWKPQSVVVSSMAGTVGEAKLRPEKALALGLRSNWISKKVDADGKAWLAESKRATDEAYVAKKLTELTTWQEGPTWPDAEEIEGISKHQKEKLAAATSGKVGALIGSAGTGKTYCTAKMLAAMSEQGVGPTAICAPTGKAAVRLTEYLNEFGLDVQAMTIHRLLQVTENGHGTGDWGFYHNETEPLPHRYIIVDEASMVSVSLFASLLRALEPSAHLLLLGDLGQLLPVEHGCPLRDVIAAGLPNGELTEIRRNSGTGVKLCHRIRNGESYTAPPPSEVDIRNGKNVIHVECRSDLVVRSKIKKLLLGSPKDINPMWDIQIIAPLNERGELSRVSLSLFVQSLLNPVRDRRELTCKISKEPNTLKDREIRIRDKVICKENSRLTVVDETTFIPIMETVFNPATGDLDQQEKLDFVANGEIGRVARIWEDYPTANAKSKAKFMAVSFDCPKRTVRVSGEGIFVFDLAGCVTVHKMQGSQAPYIIYVGDDNPSARRVGSRQLVYTALSRFEKAVFVLGSTKAIREDCQKDALSKRKTFLRELIHDGIAEETHGHGGKHSGRDSQGHNGRLREEVLP